MATNGDTIIPISPHFNALLNAAIEKSNELTGDGDNNSMSVLKLPGTMQSHNPDVLVKSSRRYSTSSTLETELLNSLSASINTTIRNTSPNTADIDSISLPTSGGSNKSNRSSLKGKSLLSPALTSISNSTNTTLPNRVGKTHKNSVSSNGGSSCHQCKSRRNYGDLTYCTSSLNKKNKSAVCRKKYCEHCLSKFYRELPQKQSSLNGNNSVWKCPSCRKICCCAACRRRETKQQSNNIGNSNTTPQKSNANGNNNSHTVSPQLSMSDEESEQFVIEDEELDEEADEDLEENESNMNNSNTENSSNDQEVDNNNNQNSMQVTKENKESEENMHQNHHHHNAFNHSNNPPSSTLSLSSSPPNIGFHRLLLSSPPTHSLTPSSATTFHALKSSHSATSSPHFSSMSTSLFNPNPTSSNWGSTPNIFLKSPRTSLPFPPMNNHNNNNNATSSDIFAVPKLPKSTSPSPQPPHNHHSTLNNSNSNASQQDTFNLSTWCLYYSISLLPEFQSEVKNILSGSSAHNESPSSDNPVINNSVKLQRLERVMQEFIERVQNNSVQLKI